MFFPLPRRAYPRQKVRRRWKPSPDKTASPPLSSPFREGNLNNSADRSRGYNRAPRGKSLAAGEGKFSPLDRRRIRPTNYRQTMNYIPLVRPRPETRQPQKRSATRCATGAVDGTKQITDPLGINISYRRSTILRSRGMNYSVRGGTRDHGTDV